MSDTVIIVENLSKSYLVGHQSVGQGHSRYTALRDVIADQARNIVRNAVNIARGRQVVLGDQVVEFCPKGCQLRGQARRGIGDYRTQRSRQKHAPQDSQPHHRADHWARSSSRSCC